MIPLAALLLVGITVGSCGTVIRSLIRQHARERALLLDQIMHLSGRTWTPPPAARESDPEPRSRETVRSPEQWPDGYDIEFDIPVGA